MFLYIISDMCKCIYAGKFFKREISRSEGVYNKLIYTTEELKTHLNQ